MFSLLLKAIGFWLLLVVTAIANAGLREHVLRKLLGGWSLPVSGITLSLLIFIVTLAIVPFFASHQASHYMWIGGLWLVFTLSFEFIFGHYYMGKSWREILEIFNLRQGNLMILVLLSTLVAPYFAAKLWGLI